MKLARPAYLTALLIALAGSGAGAWAQAACERYRAELASLTRSGAAARSYEAAAARHRDEIGRLASYYRSIGCEGFFLFRQKPAECGAIAQRLRALQANYAAIAGQAFADPSALETRRQQLRAAIARTCDAYGPDETTTTFRATGGSRLVCVRSCDGFFFPLHNDPEGRAKPADLCQALCPNAEVSVYRAPQDGGIEQAISESGKPYMELATALRYTKTLDPSCSCRKPGESWAETLQKAERMIARRSSDIVVTATISERMSRASLSAPKVRRGRDRSTTGQAAAPAVPDVETTGSIPTGGTAGAGISAEAAEVPADKGGISGSRSTPRIIAPDLIPVPRTDGAAGPRSIP
jgi:Protein of unknown function (DUF2865)